MDWKLRGHSASHTRIRVGILSKYSVGRLPRLAIYGVPLCQIFPKSWQLKHVLGYTMVIISCDVFRVLEWKCV